MVEICNFVVAVGSRDLHRCLRDVSCFGDYNEDISRMVITHQLAIFLES